MIEIKSPNVEICNDNCVGIQDKVVLHMHESQPKEADTYPKHLFISPQCLLTDLNCNHNVRGNFELLTSFSNFAHENFQIKSNFGKFYQDGTLKKIITLLNEDGVLVEVPPLELLNIALNDIIQLIARSTYTNESVDSLIWGLVKWLDKLVEDDSAAQNENASFAKQCLKEIKSNMSEFDNHLLLGMFEDHQNVSFRHVNSKLQNKINDKESLSTHHILTILLQDIFGNFISLFDGQHQMMACHRLFNSNTIINSSDCISYMLWKSPFDTKKT